MKDILVIGAGPAGCVAASYLVQQGFSVDIIEKSVFPRFAIGESLLPISMEHFKKVGLFDVLNEAKFEKKEGALFVRDKDEVDISFAENFTPGWTWTWQVPRDEFDHILAKETARKGVNILFESTIESIDFLGDQVKALIHSNDQSTEESYRFVIDSSGNAGVLAHKLSLPISRNPTGRRALFTQVKDTKREQYPRGKRITFEVLDKDLWYWVIPFSNGMTSLGFVGDKRFFEKDTKDQNDTFRQMMNTSIHFKERFDEADFLFDVKGADDYTNQSEQLYGDKFVLAGNTTGFIDPVFSSGVALATSSALLSAKLVEKVLTNQEVDWDREYVAIMKEASTVFSAVIDTWYSGELQEIFFHSEIQMSIKEQFTSVLAGYVWDKTNPFVKRNKKLIQTVAQAIRIQKEHTEKED